MTRNMTCFTKDGEKVCHHSRYVDMCAWSTVDATELHPLPRPRPRPGRQEGAGGLPRQGGPHAQV